MLESDIEGLKANDPTLQILDLMDINIGDAEAKHLAEALKTNTTLQTLYLSNNNIGAGRAKDLAEALKTNTTLQTLCLSHNNIGAAGAKDLADALKDNKTLQDLSLWNNNIGDAGANTIAETLRQNTTLQTLNLWNNNIGAAGAKDLAEALKTNTTLQTLNLYNNDIGDAGAKDLAEALKDNYSITCIFVPYAGEITGIEERNNKFAKRVAGVLRQKIEGRADAISLFTNTAASGKYFKEVYELPIIFADIQNLNKGGYSAVRSCLIAGHEMPADQCDKLLATLKNVEHFIYLRDFVLKSYKSSYLPFMAVALKSPIIGTALQLLHWGDDYNVLKATCENALGEKVYQQLAATPCIDPQRSR